MWSNCFRIVVLVVMGLPNEKVLADISHGPMLGHLSNTSASIWIRTSKPENVIVELINTHTRSIERQEIETKKQNDNTYTIRFQRLDKDTDYELNVKADDSVASLEFKTKTMVALDKDTNIVFGSCYYQPALQTEGGLIFKKMFERNAEGAIFLGDLPYSKAGRLSELRRNHKLFRENDNFMKLTSTTPTYAIYDDHDFGVDNSDGTSLYKDEALQAFTEYWPNPENGNTNKKGIYTSFTINNVEVFLLDTRYFSRQSDLDPTMLGNDQFSWLCSSLKASKSDHKIIVSGVSIASTNDDGWSGKYFSNSKKELFSCINDNKISDVIVISGDSHRSEIHKYRLGGWFSEDYLYEFTSSPLNSDIITTNWPGDDALIYGYKQEGSLFGELSLSSKNKKKAVTFKLISPINGEIKRLVLGPKELARNNNFKWLNSDNIMIAFGSFIALVTLFLGISKYRRIYWKNV